MNYTKSVEQIFLYGNNEARLLYKKISNDAVYVLYGLVII